MVFKIQGKILQSAPLFATLKTFVAIKVKRVLRLKEIAETKDSDCFISFVSRGRRTLEDFKDLLLSIKDKPAAKSIVKKNKNSRRTEVQ